MTCKNCVFHAINTNNEEWCLCYSEKIEWSDVCNDYWEDKNI